MKLLGIHILVGRHTATKSARTMLEEARILMLEAYERAEDYEVAAHNERTRGDMLQQRVDRLESFLSDGGPVQFNSTVA